MEIKIQGNDVQELGAKIEALFALFNRNPAQTELPIKEVVAPTKEAVNAGPVVVAEKKAKKTKPLDVAMETIAEKVFQATNLEVVAPAKEIFTKEDVSAAAQKLSGAKNLEAVRALMSTFTNAAGEPCKRISEIKESEYGMFIKSCDEAAL